MNFRFLLILLINCLFEYKIDTAFLSFIVYLVSFAFLYPLCPIHLTLLYLLTDVVSFKDLRLKKLSLYLLFLLLHFRTTTAQLIPPGLKFSQTVMLFWRYHCNIFLSSLKTYHPDLFLYRIDQKHKPWRNVVAHSIFKRRIVPTYSPYDLKNVVAFWVLTQNQVTIGQVLKLVSKQLWTLDWKQPCILLEGYFFGPWVDFVVRLRYVRVGKLEFVWVMLNVLIEMNYLAKRIVAMLPMMMRDIILLLIVSICWIIFW